MITWQLCRLEELSLRQAYAIFAAREAVFVVEQNCPYQDLDGKDLDAMHLIGWSGDDVAGYLRILAPGVKYAESSIGRVLTSQAARGTGVGRKLVARALQHLDRMQPAAGVRISAQAHLERFYGSFGFERVSAEYPEDGIPHIEMLRSATITAGARSR